MKATGVDLALGTDNAMFGPPDLYREARGLLEAAEDSSLDPLDAVETLLEGPKKLLYEPYSHSLAPGFRGGVTIVKGPSEEPEQTLLNAGGKYAVRRYNPAMGP
jgi:hypothetical protein